MLLLLCSFLFTIYFYDDDVLLSRPSSCCTHTGDIVVRVSFCFFSRVPPMGVQICVRVCGA